MRPSVKVSRKKPKGWPGLIAYGSVLLAALMSVSACAKTIPVSDFCLLYRPPSLTEAEWKALSEESERGILGNIAVWEEVCR